MSLLEKKYWKSLEELRGNPKFLEEASHEFAEEIPLPMFFDKEEAPLEATRRDFLKMLGFSLTGAALAACTRMPVEKAIPYLIKPEEVTPGVANWYATTCAGCSASCGLLAKVRDGRPIKIEGNPDSPLTRGGVCAVGQATVLSLYDDLRLTGPILDGQPTDWESIDKRVLKELETGGGKVILLTGTITSPTTRALIAEFLQKTPNSEQVVYDPISTAAIRAANEKSFGIRVLPRYRFDLANVIVGFNADFLGAWISPVEFAAAYAANRKPGPSMSHHVQFESGMTLTGANADLRIPINPSEEGGTLASLLKEISNPKTTDPTAKKLLENRGASLVVSGTNDINIQITVNAINALLGNIGKTVDLDNPSLQSQGEDADLARLTEEMNAGKVSVVLLYGVNPVYNTADGEKFAAGLKKVRFVVSFSDRQDETASHAHAICPDHHFLESWNDARPNSFTFQMTQPTIRPLRNTRAFQDSLLKWIGRTENYYTYLQTYWQKNLFSQQTKFADFDSFWDHTVQEGVLVLPEKTPMGRTFAGEIPPAPLFQRGVTQVLPPLAKGGGGDFELQLYEKIGLRDGRHANNPWLQELPDPVTKITWDNYASIAPSAAKRLGLEEGDVVVVKTDRGQIELPAQIQPGQAPRTVSVALGYGRTKAGKVGDRVGANAYPLIGAAFATLEKTGRHVELAATQTHHSMEGRPIVKETPLAEFVKNPKAGNEENAQLTTLWRERDKNGHQWGMAIDLNACNGCSACIVSCQAENNIPVVGKDEVRRRREMHWIRLDRYYSGSYDSGGNTALPPNPPSGNPSTSSLPTEGHPPPVAEPLSVVFMPMMCQHCNHAPCETVCPVLATVHSSDGLNQQVYNRCVGTRYCENNCPYKVRRFNWFDYAHNDKFDYEMNNDLGTMVLNPDTVVRSRGVMEKCSMCIQRIQEGKLQAKREGRTLGDGEIKTACQQSCPPQAIVFGDLNDPESRIAKLNQEGRFYHVLEELNVRPNVGYLTKVRNKT